MIDQPTLFAALAVLLVALAILAFVAGEILVAGVLMLATTFAIYLRETRA